METVGREKQNYSTVCSLKETQFKHNNICMLKEKDKKIYHANTNE